MKEDSLVSIITAVYNCEKFIPLLIACMKGQLYTNWEWIIVDDGSADTTYEKLKRLQTNEKRAKCIRHRINKGAAAARNTALTHCSGEFIAIMDGDDTSRPDRIKIQVNFLLANPDIHVVGSAIEAVDQTGRFLEYRYRPETHEVLVDRIFYENPFYHSTVMARSAFFEASGGYNPKLRRCQDYDLWLRTYRAFRFHNLQEPLVQYRVRNSVSWNSVFYSTLVLLKAMQRERVPLLKRWIAARGPVKKACEEFPLLSIFYRIFHYYYHSSKCMENQKHGRTK